MTDLYTFIMDYLEGTYISQVEAINEKEAVILWITNLETKGIKKFSKEDKKEIIQIYSSNEDEHPILIDKLKNIWCVYFRTKRGVALVNFVKTVKN